MKTAIIIGASSGIGQATAIALSTRYDNICITSRSNIEGLNATKESILSNKCNCYMEFGDAGDFQFMKSFINNCVAQFGDSIDLLVNNAGTSYIGLLTDMSDDEWHSIFKSNVDSVWCSCRQVIPHMIHNKHGRIINISSVWGICGASCEVAYSATKGAVNSFTKALAKELAPSGISVNAIAFGAIDTSMNNHLSAEEKAELTDEIPVGRMATVNEAANFIVDIAMTESYLTGQIITFDGAWI